MAAKNHDGGSVHTMRRTPFWPAWLDEAGLDPITVRVLAHVVRVAASSGVFFEARPKVAKTCRIGARKVFAVLQALVACRVLAVEGQPSRGRAATRYRLLPVEGWDLTVHDMHGSTVHHTHAQPCTARRPTVHHVHTEGSLEGSLPEGSAHDARIRLRARVVQGNAREPGENAGDYHDRITRLMEEQLEQAS